MAVRSTTMSLDAAMNDVEARFLYNLPENELTSPERLFFQIEQAYWFYEDFKADKFPNLPHFASLKSFAQSIFQHCDLLKQHKTATFQQLFADFSSYKAKIPVCGCIILNPQMTKVLLVCDYNTGSWMFPRGKINQNETELQCAIRETAEETNFNASPYCNEHDFITSFQDQKKVQLFIAANVPENTVFEIHTRKEISKIEFHSLDNLPKRTYHVHPFIQSLKRWIAKHRKASPSTAASTIAPAARMLTRNGVQKLIVPSSVLTASTSGKATTSSARNNNNNNNNNSSSNDSSVKASTSSKKKLTPSTLTAVAQLKTQKQQQQQSKPKNGFDARNTDTFADSSNNNNNKSDRWSVQQMFQANSQLTGRQYDYNGNPHAFGSYHPRYVNYNAASGIPLSTSVIDKNNSAEGDDAFLKLSLQSRKVGEKLLRGVEHVDENDVNVLEQQQQHQQSSYNNRYDRRSYFAQPFVIRKDEVMNAVNLLLEANPVHLSFAM